MASVVPSIVQVPAAVRTAAAAGRRGKSSQARPATAPLRSRAARVQSRSQQRSVVVAAVAEGLEPGLPSLDGPTAVSRIVEVAPSWQQLRVDHLTALSSTMGKGQAMTSDDLKARCLAMSQLSDGTTWEVMDSPDVIGVYSEAYDGGLGDCATIVDTHVRLLADRLLRGDCSKTVECYSKLEALPPNMRKQQTAATAAVGAAALLQISENADLFRSMLALAEEGERDEAATAEFLANEAICDAVEEMLQAMPQPKE